MKISPQNTIFIEQYTKFASDFFEIYGLYLVGILAILIITLPLTTKGRFFAPDQPPPKKRLEPRHNEYKAFMNLMKYTENMPVNKKVPAEPIRNLLSVHEQYLEARFQRRPGVILTAKRSLDHQFLTLTGEPYGHD